MTRKSGGTAGSKFVDNYYNKLRFMNLSRGEGPTRRGMVF